MPLTAAGSPLVGGSLKVTPQPPTQKVRVLRAFLIKSEVQKVGATLEMTRALALELRSLNKVEFVKDEPKPEPKPKKESSNAQQ